MDEMNHDLEEENHDNNLQTNNMAENASDPDENSETIKTRVGRLVDKLSGLL